MVVARQMKQAIIDELTEINTKQQEDIKKLEDKIKRHDSNYKKALKQFEIT